MRLLASTERAPSYRRSKPLTASGLPAAQRAAAPFVPPIKTQGIKTKLVGFILGNVDWDGFAGQGGRWIEPFLGSGVVLFNARPRMARSGDANVHIVDFYTGIQSGRIVYVKNTESCHRRRSDCNVITGATILVQKTIGI